MCAGGKNLEKQKTMKAIPFFEAIAVLIGTIVGAGFLGIPYVVAQVGFPIGVLLILGIGMVMLVQYLMIAEMALRTEGRHQLAGYIQLYLGSRWKNFAHAILLAEAYGALLAYVVGSGRVLGALFGTSPWLMSYVFLVCGAIVLYFGLQLIEKVDLLFTLLMGAVVTLICFVSWSQIRFENFLSLRLEGLLPAYGVILFSFGGAAAIPEAREVLFGHEKQFPRAITIAILFPIFIYSIFTAAVLGVTGAATTEVATIGLGAKLGRAMVASGNILALITISTAFMGLSLSLKETFWYDLKLPKREAWLLTILVPLILFSFGLHNFIQILFIVGVLFGGLLGIVLVFASLKAERAGKRKPEFVVPYKRIFGAVLVIVFTAGIFYGLIDFIR
ncbi:MAG: hypothetical protein A2722_00215 [Candidatus Doudnabacteria bacterium RIFCSPHIGHO2_01_FULL_50_11]|uniref:Amino acid transporter transmembrane domain-containing protein n=1 Tax=Candidatus Doudnabacteria bacterium RIFCSPHIGHO2_01_FULL_50_11 TaxID=1817828 RepID=A0A1F5PI72_9BACT|nr:MAG: hypothetical protein A2722_00215 [Candidatus Doudnabacteria bacterium RIFCSPHIGHO2_01_FULL_50_11]